MGCKYYLGLGDNNALRAHIMTHTEVELKKYGISLPYLIEELMSRNSKVSVAP